MKENQGQEKKERQNEKELGDKEIKRGEGGEEGKEECETQKRVQKRGDEWP